MLRVTIFLRQKGPKSCARRIALWTLFHVDKTEKITCINKSQICASLQIKWSNILMCCSELNYTKLCLNFTFFQGTIIALHVRFAQGYSCRWANPQRSTWYSNRKLRWKRSRSAVTYENCVT